jgi:hypothetical protein
MRPACGHPHHGCMDIVAVILGLIAFGALYALILGIERI